jgi:hypothetical protein
MGLRWFESTVLNFSSVFHYGIMRCTHRRKKYDCEHSQKLNAHKLTPSGRGERRGSNYQPMCTLDGNYIGTHCSPIVGQSAKGPISPRRSGTSRRQVVRFNMVFNFGPIV